MATTNRRKSYVTWVIVAVVAIIVLLFSGLLPLPGQKDNVTPHSQPSPEGKSPMAELPKGASPSPPSEAGQGTQPPPGERLRPHPAARRMPHRTQPRSNALSARVRASCAAQ